MNYSKYYNPTNWENYPSEDTAINAMHLNNLEDGVDTLDDRIVALSTDKSEVSWNQTLISGEKIAEITVNGITKDVYAPEISDSVVEQAAEQALKSEGYAVGTQGDIPVTSGLYYHNNSKYYSEQASDSASDASASAVEAGQSADGAAEEALVSEGWANGKQNGVPVEEGSPYYHNNAQYYCEEARNFTPEGYQELVDDIDYYEQNGYLSKNSFIAKNFTEQKKDGIVFPQLGEGAYISQDLKLPAGTYTIWILLKSKPSANRTIAFRNTTDGTDLANFTNISSLNLNQVYSTTFTISGEKNCSCRIWGVGGGSFEMQIQIEEGSTATSYTPYAPSNNELTQISAIGTDESGRTTASRSYAQGEHFYKDGKFCTAKTAIASGATFTLNTNYVEGDIATELKGTGNVGLSTTGYTQTSYEFAANNLYMKNGRVVMYLLVKTLTPSTSNFIDIGILPSNIDKPLVDLSNTSMSFDGGYNGGQPFQWALNATTGRLSVKGGVANCRYPVMLSY